MSAVLGASVGRDVAWVAGSVAGTVVGTVVAWVAGVVAGMVMAGVLSRLHPVSMVQPSTNARAAMAYRFMCIPP